MSCTIVVNGCDGEKEPGSKKCRDCEDFEAQVDQGFEEYLQEREKKEGS